jgi:hypothetical protein
MLTDLAALPARWPQASSLSILSPERDHFDITFASYDRNQSTAGSSYIDVVPPILHHINLGSKPPRDEWMDARNHCIAHHPGWETFLWDDARAKTFVATEFPHLKHMWDNYLFPVQRVDALRYMLLQKYGGEFESLSISRNRPHGSTMVDVTMMHGRNARLTCKMHRSGAGFRSCMQAKHGAAEALRLCSAGGTSHWLLDRHDVG